MAKASIFFLWYWVVKNEVFGEEKEEIQSLFTLGSGMACTE